MPPSAPPWTKVKVKAEVKVEPPETPDDSRFACACESSRVPVCASWRVRTTLNIGVNVLQPT